MRGCRCSEFFPGTPRRDPVLRFYPWSRSLDLRKGISKVGALPEDAQNRCSRATGRPCRRGKAAGVSAKVPHEGDVRVKFYCSMQTMLVRKDSMKHCTAGWGALCRSRPPLVENAYNMRGKSCAAGQGKGYCGRAVKDLPRGVCCRTISGPYSKTLNPGLLRGGQRGCCKVFLRVPPRPCAAFEPSGGCEIMLSDSLRTPWYAPAV
jgi:hypothetical protein